MVVHAVGHAGGERLRLFVDGQPVAIWSMEGSSRFYSSSVRYDEFTFVSPTPLSGHEVRLVFVNDGRSGGVGRDVRIDAIEVGETRYEAEGGDVFGTGSYNNGARCRPGRWRSEFLHCNGYLQFQVD